MALFYQNKNSQSCSNCGGTGHTFRFCSEPVSSYGVLAFRWISKNQKWPQINELCSDYNNYTGTTHLIPQVLMIQRKDSLGFMDIMRGKYKINEPDYIKKQLRGMTEEERTKLETMDFEEIWHLLWGSDTESSKRYAHDRITSRQKLTELRAGVELGTGERYTLSDLLRQEPVIYKTPEWGFPKGRRDSNELDIQCAFRELAEETGITEDEVLKLTNVAPFIEQFHGSNGIHYRHSYYVAQYIGQRDISFDALNIEMAREIRNLAWKNLDEAVSLLRPENIEKRASVLQISELLRSFSPVIRTELHGIPRGICENENTSGEQEYVFTSRDQRDSGIQGGLDKTKRFFGARQTTRRIQDIHSTNTSTNNKSDWSR
jgi:8-oxo-dGTP pyrophosphatase MutT (NUDIX family)